MAEEKDFSLVEGRDPSTWSSFGVSGREYRKFLLDAEENGEKSKLTERQKDDLKALLEYEIGSENDNDRKQIEYDESLFTAEYWIRMKGPYDIAFYLSYPQWALSETNKQIQAYIFKEYFDNGKSMVAICNNARKKIGLPEYGSKKNLKDNSKEQQEKNMQEQQPTNKGFMFWVKRLVGDKNHESEKFNQNEEDIKRETDKVSLKNEQSSEEHDLDENERISE